MSDEFKPFIPLGNPTKPSDFGIQPIGPSPTGTGDLHDTFGVNPDGTLKGGHTTVRIPGGFDIKMPWDPKP
ncbi:MAG: hypothetical protein AAB458_01650 [Patescibacteria group bacterium]